MAMLNIPSSVEDPSYRYKMPRIISNKECRGKGSKTSIMNMGDVAHAIKRDPMYLTKFFGYELGAQTSYTNKKGEGERAVINGHHDTPIFQRLLDDFIEKYVLCMECHLPEIDMVVNKKGLVAATCKACGWNGKLDNCHKLATYISKNPPSSGIGFEEKNKKTKEDRQRERAAKQKTRECDGDHDANSDPSEMEQKENTPTEDTKDIDEDGGEDEAKDKKKKERKSKKEKARDQDGDEDSYEDGEAKDKKTKKETKDKKEQNDKKLKKDKKDHHQKKDKKKEAETYSGSDEKESDEKEEDGEEEDLRYDGRIMSGVVKEFVEFVKKNEKITVDQMYEEVRAQQVTRGFDNKSRMYVVLSALFPNGTLSATGVKHRSRFIKEFITNGRLPFAEWIWGLEAYLAANPRATKVWAMTLKTLYDEDLVEEEQILEYYRGQHDSPGFDASKKAAAPFIKWLETPEDGSDEDGRRIAVEYF